MVTKPLTNFPCQLVCIKRCFAGMYHLQIPLSFWTDGSFPVKLYHFNYYLKLYAYQAFSTFQRGIRSYNGAVLVCITGSGSCGQFPEAFSKSNRANSSWLQDRPTTGERLCGRNSSADSLWSHLWRTVPHRRDSPLEQQ